MFCQHTEPAVYYTCRVSSSCDDLKLGEYTTTQDTFCILLNNIVKSAFINNNLNFSCKLDNTL